MTGPWPLFCAALLSGCAEAPARVELARPAIPAPLRDCPARPAPPEAAESQRQAALYLIALAEAHGLCRDRLRALADLLSDPPAGPTPDAS